MANENINLDQVREVARLGVRRAASFMALGLRTAADESIRSVMLDTNFVYVFMPNPLTVEQSAEVRESFAEWVIGNGLRELDQHFAAYVNSIHFVLAVRINARGLPHDEAIRQQKAMEGDTNLGNKLARLEDAFRITLSWRSHIASLSYARNALTHNLARVGPRHCNDGDVLRLKWLGINMIVGDTIISGPFDEVVGEAGTKIILRAVNRERVLRIGELVEFSPHDLSEICQMFSAQADEIYNKVAVYILENKVPHINYVNLADAPLANG